MNLVQAFIQNFIQNSTTYPWLTAAFVWSLVLTLIVVVHLDLQRTIDSCERWSRGFATLLVIGDLALALFLTFNHTPQI